VASETTTVRVTEAGAQALRRLAFTLSAQTGKRVTLSSALIAAVSLAAQDIPAAVAALPAGDE